MRNKKLFSAFLMLLITMVSLTSASYAWFSQNVAVQLEGLELNVEAADGIQVSTDAENWRASLDVQDIIDGYTGHTNQVPSILSPVSTIGSQSTGNFEMFSGSLNEEGTTTLTTTGPVTEVAGTFGEFIAFDLFVRTTTTEAIYLDDVSDIGYVSGDGTSESVGLEYSSRIAFFNQGTDGTYTPATARALAGGTSATQVIWEPHALSHTTAALGQGASTTEKTPYYGVKAAGTELPLSDFASQTEYFELVETITPDTDTVPFDTTNPDNIIFTAEPGITKIRVYVWFEGQDIDNENSAALGLSNDADSYLSLTIKFLKLEA